MKLFHCHLFFLIFISQVCFGGGSTDKGVFEGKDDSLKVNGLNRLAFEIKGVNPDSSIYLSTEALKISNQLKYRFGEANSNLILGMNYSNFGNFDEANKYLNISIKILDGLISEGRLERNQLLSLKALSLNNLGNTFEQHGIFPKALEYHYAALKLRESIHEEKTIPGSLNNIGIVNRDLKKYESALSFFFKAASMNKKLGNKKWLSLNLTNIGNIFSDEYKFDSAIYYQNQALNLAIELNDY